MEGSCTSIRLIRVSDAEAYDAFMASMFAENLDTLPHRVSSGDVDLLVQHIQKCTGEHSALFIAENAGRLIGGIGINRVDQPSRSHISVLGMNVASGFRGQGIGRAMLKHALEWADAAPSIERIELEVTVQNLPAIHLYEAFGFRREGIKSKALKKDNTYFDLIIMARIAN